MNDPPVPDDELDDIVRFVEKIEGDDTSKQIAKAFAELKAYREREPRVRNLLKIAQVLGKLGLTQTRQFSLVCSLIAQPNVNVVTRLADIANARVAGDAVWRQSPEVKKMAVDGIEESKVNIHTYESALEKLTDSILELKEPTDS